MGLGAVSVVEAAYALDLDESEWLAGVAQSAASLLDQGLGVHAYVYDLNGAERFRTNLHVAPGSDDRWQKQWQQLTESSEGREFLHGVHRTQPRFSALSTFLDQLGPARSFVDDMMQRSGYADFLSINAFDPSGVGVFVGVPMPRRAQLVRRVSARWARVGGHIASALRLRRRASSSGAAEDAETDAVFTPDGKLEHLADPELDAESREALRTAVVAIERARGSQLTQDDAALEQWRVLEDGRWTLVDQFERGGRRYVVARRNPPEVRGPAALTEREKQVVAYAAMGHSNKFIAYELGLSVPSIATYLARGMRKLGVGSRVQLVALFSTLTLREASQ